MNVMYKMSSILCSTTKVLWTEVLLALLLDSWHRYFMVKNCEDHQQHHHLHILQSKKSLAKRQASFISINISAAAAAVMGRASRCEKYSLWLCLALHITVCSLCVCDRASSKWWRCGDTCHSYTISIISAATSIQPTSAAALTSTSGQSITGSINWSYTGVTLSHSHHLAHNNCKIAHTNLTKRPGARGSDLWPNGSRVCWKKGQDKNPCPTWWRQGGFP